MATGRIGTTPVLTTRWSKAPAGGTTSLSGLDDNSVSLVYSVGFEQVYRNGVLLSRGNDYTATSGTSITLTDATITGDIIEVFANATVALTDTYTQTQANGKFINNTLTTTTGDIIYASAANTPARLGIGSTDQVLKVSGGIPTWGAVPATTPTFKGVLVTNTVGQSISNNTTTTLNFDLETYDTDSFHSTSTNTSRLTVPSSGYYFVYAKVRWAGNSSSYRYILFRKNGTTSYQDILNYPPNASDFSQYFGLALPASANDYFEVRVTQASGGSLELRGDDNGSVAFGCYYLGA